jgi:hypothetical protein
MRTMNEAIQPHVGTIEVNGKRYNVGVRIDERAEKSDRVVTGGVDEVVERLAGFVRMGVNFLNLWPAGGADLRERLAKEVVPKVRELAG